MVINLALVIVLIICMVTDYKYRKIYNKVLFPSLIIAFLLNFLFYGTQGLRISGVGSLVGFGFFFLPFVFRWIAAGDIKLVAVVGAFKGYEFVLLACLFIAAVGGVLSIFYVIKHKQVKQTITKLSYFIGSLFAYKKNLTSVSKEIESSSIPYGIAIGIGTMATLVLQKAMII